MIIPRSNFSCNGRITGYQISLRPGAVTDPEISLPPIVQVWHPISSTVYTRVDTECLLTANDITLMSGGPTNIYYLGSMSCTGNNRIEFQAGDVIGFYHGSFALYDVYTITTMGYISYIFDVNNQLDTLNINNADSIVDF